MIEQLHQIGLGAAREIARDRAKCGQLRRRAGTPRRPPPDGRARRLIAFVEPVGIDQGEGRRKVCCAFVMIDDDDIHARRLGLRPAPHSAIAPQSTVTISRLPASPSAPTPRPMGHSLRAGGQGCNSPPLIPSSRSKADQQRRAGCAVNVIVAVDRHGSHLLHASAQPFSGAVHVPEHRRIGHESAYRRLAVAFQIIRGDAARQQQLRDKIVRREIRIARINVSAAPFPALAQDGCVMLRTEDMGKALKGRRR